MSLNGIKWKDQSYDLNNRLKTNQLFNKSFETKVSGTISSPYWLIQKGSQGMYTTDKTEWIGAAKSPAAYLAELSFSIEGKKLKIRLPLQFRRTDPVRGEVVTPFHILPKAGLQLEAPIFLFATGESRRVKVSVKNLGPSIEGTLKLESPESWEFNPKSIQVAIKGKGNQSDYYFDIKAPLETTVGYLKPLLQTPTKNFKPPLKRSLTTISPNNIWFPLPNPKWWL